MHFKFSCDTSSLITYPLRHIQRPLRELITVYKYTILSSFLPVDKSTERMKHTRYS